MGECAVAVPLEWSETVNTRSLLELRDRQSGCGHPFLLCSRVDARCNRVRSGSVSSVWSRDFACDWTVAGAPICGLALSCVTANSSGFIMINPSLITLLPVVICAWLIFESLETSVLAKSHRSGVARLLTLASHYRSLFLPLSPPPILLHSIQTLVGSIHLATDQRSSLQSP